MKENKELKRSAVVCDLNMLIDLIPMFRETIYGISYTNCGAIGRKPLKDIAKFIRNDSNPRVYIYWKDEKKYIDITTKEPGYEVFVGDNMFCYFHKTAQGCRRIVRMNCAFIVFFGAF